MVKITITAEVTNKYFDEIVADNSLELSAYDYIEHCISTYADLPVTSIKIEEKGE